MEDGKVPATSKLAVIGGGAAGMIAAIAAAEALKEQKISVKIMILEKNPRFGKKLLATGNGRCNLTNINASADDYYGAPWQAKPVLELYPPQKIIDTFQRFGLLCKEEGEGRVYPYGGQASAVLDVLRKRLSALQVEEKCGETIISIQKSEKGFCITSEHGSVFYADRLILAAGGKASPQLSSDGAGFPLCKQLGHSVTPLYPALVQVKSPSGRVKALKGMRCQAQVTLLADGKSVGKEIGEVQFTENGLSGICVFQLSRFVSQYSDTGSSRRRFCQSMTMSLDLMPEYTTPQICSLLFNQVRLDPEIPAQELLAGILNKRVGQEVVKAALPDRKGCLVRELGKKDVMAIAKQVKNFCFPVLGAMPWGNAQVTAGGVPLEEIHLPAMESKKTPGCFLAGEMLNLDGPCGGFNLHWAWASGLAAGKAAAESLKK